MSCKGDTDRAVCERQKTIFIADDDDDIVSLLTARCNEMGCTVIGASNAIDALNAISRCKPDVVCLDVNMPAGNGLGICEMMAADEQLREIPIIILTGRSDPTTIRRCHEMMAYYVEKNADVWSRVKPLLCELLQADAVSPTASTQRARESHERSAVHDPRPPVGSQTPASRSPYTGTTGDDTTFGTGSAAAPPAADKETLMDAVFEMLGDHPDLIGARRDRPGTNSNAQSERGNDPPWVLCIDDDTDFSEALACRLEAHGVAVVRAFNGMEGYRLAFTHPASAILLDHNMPNGQGDYVLCRLKDNPVTKDIPVFIVTGNKDRRLEQRMRVLGANGFLTKPLRFDLLRETLAGHLDILEAPAHLCGSSSRCGAV